MRRENDTAAHFLGNVSMSDVVLGVSPPANADRDAIHVAVIPMRAAELLRPGQRVGIVGDQLAGPSADVVGIVDPYLVDVVPKDGWFWLALLPGTVQGMRHHWQHSAFVEAPQAATDVEGDKHQAETWLREYAHRVSPYDDPGKAFNRLVDGLRTGELFFYGTDLHSFGDVNEPEELKRNAELFLGITIDWGRFEYSCSC
jgi:hypothetical protein